MTSRFRLLTDLRTGPPRAVTAAPVVVEYDDPSVASVITDVGHQLSTQ